VPLPGIFGRFTGALFGNALGYGVGSAMGPVITPPIQGLANDLWRKHPVKPIDASVAAQVALKQPQRHHEMLEKAKETGFGGNQFDDLKAAMDVPLGLGELITLFQRGHVNGEEFIRGLRAALIEEAWVQKAVLLAETVLSPQEAALLRQRGHLTQAEQHAEAKLSGVSSERAEKQFAGSGISMGIGEALELARRKELDRPAFQRVVAEGDTRVEWADDLWKLRRTVLSASVAAEARVRERTTETRARQIAHENGLSDEDFDLLVNIGGRPIAPGEALQAVNRELVGPVGSPQSRSFFHEVVARSDVRTEYANLLYELRERFPSLFELRRLIQEGAVSDELATSIVLKEGYSHELAHGIVTAAHSQKSRSTKELAVTQIRSLYEAGLETQEWAIGVLTALGYSHENALLEVQLIDAQRLITALRERINVIHRTYVGHKVDRTQAMAELDGLAVGDVARELLLSSWDAEREANVTRLTNAQIGSALKHGVIKEADAIARWEANGYPVEDAQVLAKLATIAPHGASPTAA
jgi:hypothetical protein